MLKRGVVPVLAIFGALAVGGCSQPEGVPSGQGTAAAADAEQAAAEADPIVVTEFPDDIDPESRGRLAAPVRDSFEGDDLRSYDAVVYPGSRWENGPTTQVAMLMHSPFLAEHFAAVSSHVRFNSGRPQRLTELGILTAALELRSQYVWTSHEPLALQAGLEPGIVELLKSRAPVEDGEGLPGFGDEERVIVRFIREDLSEEKVSSDTFRRAYALFGERGVAELVGLIGHYTVVNATNKAFDQQRQLGEEMLLPNLWEP